MQRILHLAWVTVGQHPDRKVGRQQALQRGNRVGKRRELGELVHQQAPPRRIQRKMQRVARILQSVFDHLGERNVTARHRAQAGVLELLVAPQLRQRRASAREQMVGAAGNRMHVKQGSVKVEQNRAQCLPHDSPPLAVLRPRGPYRGQYIGATVPSSAASLI